MNSDFQDLILSMARTGRGLTRSTELAALKQLTSEAKLSDCCSILVTHVLRTAVEYVNLVNEIFPVKTVIAIPYSSEQSAIQELREFGFNVIVPDSVKDTFRKAFTSVTEVLRRSDQPLVVQEVGGYLAGQTKELARYKHFRGIVEDTNNGHWRYEYYAPHKLPILSMAQSPLKDIEDTIIGDATVFSIERILREEFAAILQGARCGIVGYGKIGTSCAISLRGRESVVSIYDIDPAKNMRAKVEGFFPMPLHNILDCCELVIGATGQTSIRREDLSYIRDGAILASSSSKNWEFALKDFAEVCQVERVNEVSHRYETKKGKCFYILNEGHPVNFRDGSILGTILDMIYAELFVCMRQVAERKADIDLQHSGPSIQNEVAKVWLQAHSPIFATVNDDKVWTYPDSLSLGQRSENIHDTEC